MLTIMSKENFLEVYQIIKTFNVAQGISGELARTTNG